MDVRKVVICPNLFESGEFRVWGKLRKAQRGQSKVEQFRVSFTRNTYLLPLLHKLSQIENIAWDGKSLEACLHSATRL